MEMSITEIRDNLADALNRVAYGKERVVLTRRGKGVAAIIPMDEYEFIQRAEDRDDVRAARKALKDYRRNGGMKLSEYRKKNGI